MLSLYLFSILCQETPYQLDRAVRLLGHAQAINVPRSTYYRAINSLIEFGLIRRVGMDLYEMGSVVTSSINIVRSVDSDD